MGEDLKTTTERVIDLTKDAAAAFAPLWSSYRSGNRGLVEISQPITAYVMAIVKAVGELWPSLEDVGERERIAETAILRVLDLVGVDLPGPDALYVRLLIRATVLGWRYSRDTGKPAQHLLVASAA